MTEFTLSGIGLLYAVLALSAAVALVIYGLKFWYIKLSKEKQDISEKGAHLPKGLKSRNKYQELDVFAISKPIWMFGLGTALLFTLFAFSWEQVEAKVYIPDNAGFIDEEVDVIRTKPKPPKPPPPPPPPPVEIIEVPDDDIVDEPDMVSMEVDETTEMEVYEPVIEAAAPPPPPPPPPPKDDGIIEIHNFAEVMPRFPGCENFEGTRLEKDKCAEEKMLQYIYSKVKYPSIARENGIEGRATLQFVVDEMGNITNVNIVRDVAGGCGQAAEVVVKGMPKWNPGMQAGKKVKVRYTLPIVFELQN